MLSAGATVHVVRLRARVRDPSGTRQGTRAHALADAVSLHAGRLLASADVQPASLSAHAILCVRRLGDPKPRRLTLDGRALRPPVDWEESARTAIAQAAAAAARPALGAVPASAGAILFADRAELLACLARDWCDDLFHSSWWWRALLGSRDAAETVLRAFRETPQAVPAALDTLARARRLESFLRRLTRASARAIAHDVGRTFGLDDVEGAIAEHGRALGKRTDATEASPRSGVRPITPPVEAQKQVAPEIAAIAPEVVHLDLVDAPLALAIVALVLHRAPAVARSVLHPRIVPDQPPLRRSRRSRSVDPDVDAAGALNPASTELREETADEVLVPRARPAAGKVEAAATPDLGAAERAPSDRAIEPTSRFEPGSPAGLLDATEVVATSFGGTFYLINVAISLGLYADFTVPTGGNLALPIWDFLAITTDRLAGPGFADDPLSALFASLAGRGPAEPIDPRQPVVRRVRRLVPSLRRRIARGLGVHLNVAGPLLVMAPARVLVTTATLEVRFSLAELPIEVRLAGLDRDPGFVPAAARSVTFTYV